MIDLKPYHQKPSLCGPASLKMVMDYYSVSASEDELAKIAGSTLEDGTTIEGMIKAARHFGFKVLKKEKASINDIKGLINKGTPVIVRWFFDDWGHYSVVVDINKKKVVLMDPILKKFLIFVKKRVIPIEKFMHIWFDYDGQFLEKKEDVSIRPMLVLIPKK